MSQVVWREWEDEVLEAARASDRPLLLFLKASWCRFCRDMEESVFADPALVALVEQSFVPIRVDKDRRPEIDQRYNMGGWPTLAVLTPAGDLLTGGSDLSAEDVPALLRDAVELYRSQRDHIDGDMQQVWQRQCEVDDQRVHRQGQLQPAIVDKVAAAILNAFDRRHGGFGTGQKFPHPEAIDFAILYYARTQDAAYGELVQKTLSSMAEGSLFDPVSGAFFRFCGTRDWRQPHTEVLLETQAGLLRNYLEASQIFGRADFLKVARKITGFLESTLHDAETGGYFGSQDADDVYYSQDEVERRDRKPPRVEPTCYTPSVAMTVSSLLKASSVLHDERLHRRGLAALHFLLERCYSQGRGMYHYYDGARHILGLLTDQIYTARALIHAIQYTGDNDYLPILEDLIATIVKKQSATYGGFYDLPEGGAKFGSLRRRHTSLLENGVMAEVLLRAYSLTDHASYRELAERTLRAFASDYQRYGYFTAGYARAVELFYRPPLRVVVVGAAADPVRQEMLRRAQETYVPSKVVMSVDPDREGGLLRRLGFPGQGAARTYLCQERACVAEIRSAEEVPAAMATVGLK